jgi:hypothetical protein
MLIGVKAPLKEGDTLKAKLAFKNAGAVDVEFPVKASGGAMPMDHMHMDDKSMQQMPMPQMPMDHQHMHQ